VKTIIWHNCYDASLKGLVTKESFAHPAKMARGLCERILDYGRERGYWKPGDLIVDPFGGIGTTGLVGAYRGYRVVSVELEPKFVEMHQANIERNRKKLERIGAPLPVVVQGDSRKLRQLVAEAVGAVMSPPWSNVLSRDVVDANARVAWAREHGISNAEHVSPVDMERAGARDQDYGKEAGQIGTMPEGNLSSVIGAVMSPPFAGNSGGHGEASSGPVNARYPGVFERHTGSMRNGAGYGASEGQINAMPAGDPAQVIGAISSPPYEGVEFNADQNQADSGKPLSRSHQSYSNIAGAIASPPYGGNEKSDYTHEARDRRRLGDDYAGKGRGGSFRGSENYGETDGQIGRMPMGAITSPPYADSEQDYKEGWARFHSNGRTPSHKTDLQREANYGSTPGQMGALLAGDVSEVMGAITSPPYEDSLRSEKHDIDWLKVKPDYPGREWTPAVLDARERSHNNRLYGESDGQIVAEAGETYWAAVAQVYQELFAILPPGGACAIVVKNYVKAKQIVPLCDQTAQLLDAIGFEVVERVRAMLVKESSTPTLFGDNHIKRTSRKSFFRRLAEKNGSPEINFEEVIWAVKPVVEA